MKKKYLVLIASALVISSACNKNCIDPNVYEPTHQEESLQDASSIDVNYLNKDIRPQDDFFEFSNGTWIKDNPVPPSESRWGSFNELEKTNNEKLTKLLEDASNSKAMAGSTQQILGDYYASFIDMETRNKIGMEAIDADIDLVEKINSKKDLPTVIAKQHALDIHALFGFGVGQDLKDVDNHTVYFGQGGIGLPNKDYYLTEDKAEILIEYRKHIVRIGQMINMSQKDAETWASDVIAFESTLAKSMMAPAELRIPEKTYNKVARTDINSNLSLFNFETYLLSSGIDSFDTLIVGQPRFVATIDSMVKHTDLTVWKNYLKWKTVDHYAGHLSHDFVQANFDFYGTILSGKSELKPINERAIAEITGQEFSEILGKAFVEQHFSQAAQDRVNKMVDNLLVVFNERIRNLEWMSDDTKKQALLKLRSIGRKLGYPSKWEDFSELKFTRNAYVGNIKETARYAHIKNLKKLSKKVDKEEWAMPAHMVNAYYHPLLNEIAFPAGIMQAPFFDENYEDAVNYGRIGMVIGHEFTHGFDDMGSKFAADGSFMNWWTTQDRELFEERTGKLGATFSGFCPIDGHCVNPDLTMGENIADLGGLTLAYHAYTMTDDYKSGVEVSGYTPAQRFFIAYAQLWKINYTEEELKNRIANDPHSPGMYRVNGPLMNCPEFFEAFEVLEVDPMRNSESKISRIW